MPLGMEVGLRRGDIVLGGDPALSPPPKRGTAPLPNFRPVSVVAKCSPISATAELLLRLVHELLPSSIYRIVIFISPEIAQYRGLG